MSAKSSYPGDVKSSDNPSDQSDYIWYCKSDNSTSASYDATISTSARYFYATNSSNYWLRTASGDANQVRLTTSSSSAESYSIDNSGYLREETGSYFVYYQASDGTWRTSNISTNYNGKRPNYIEYTGDNINSTTVYSYPEVGGYVYVREDTDSKPSTMDLTTDVARRKYPACFYMYAKPESGYEFLGWSKTPGGTIESTATTYMVSVVNSNETYYANYRGLNYTVSFVKNNDLATGSMNPVTPAIGVDYTLPELGFIDNITVTFDANGGTFPAKGTNNYSETQSKFNEWNGSDGNTYANKGIINKSTPDAITLTAQWNSSRNFTVPNATRGDRELRGYNHDTTSSWVKPGTSPGSTIGPSSSYTLYAVWGDPFYAQVNLAKTEGTSGTPTVDVAKKSSDTKNTDLTFTITAPSASSGYYFTGWTYSGTGVSITDVSKLTTTVKVKSSSTAGSTNTATITANYAGYSRIITINTSGTPSGSSDRIVFNITGPVTYRVSVPVGGSVTLKDVPSGSYTITPQGWSWSYNVSPASDSTSWDDKNKSTHTFSFTSKGSTKKHSEVNTTIKP